MMSNLGRGRGYSGKNKDIIRAPGNISDNERPSAANSSQRNYTEQFNKSDDGFSDSDRNVKKQTGKDYRNKNRPSPNVPKQQSRHEKYETPGMRGGTSNVHVLKKGESTNDNVKYSQDFLRAISVSDENRQSVLFIDEKHHSLLKQVSLLSPQDDGILFNQKLQYIGEILTKQYKEQANLREALDALASAAILDSRVSVKVSLLCCSVWFSCYQMFGNKLHNIFIEALTDKIDGLEVSLEGADQYLVNTVTLLSSIFTETKMLSEEELTTIARLIVQVIIQLLECYTPLALKTLNIQLMVHGRKLYQSVPDKVESLSISARKLLIAKQPPAPSCRIWLTLLADQCLCKLEPLPKYLEDFYSVHLDESQNTFEDKTYNRKGDHSNYTDYKNANTQYGEKSRRSDSSDIYSIHSNGEKGSECDQKYSDDVFEERSGQHDSSFDSSGISDTNASENYDCYNSNTSQNSERKPRPILGAGARFGQALGKPVNFSEPPPPLNNVHQLSEDNIPVFCPSIPPPNFIPKSLAKQITSASQDSADYWNTPPPPLPNTNKKKENNPVVQTSSVLAKRLDLNSWRQENSEPVDYECDNSKFNVENDQGVDDNSDEHETSIVLLNKIKGDTYRDTENLDLSEQVNPLPQRSKERKKNDQVFYERRQSGLSGRETVSDSNWDESEMSNLQISCDNKKSNQNRTEQDKDKERQNTYRNQGDGHSDRRHRDNNKPKSMESGRLTGRESMKQRNDRPVSSDNKEESEEKENNRRPKDSRERRTDRGERREKKNSDQDKDTSGEDKKTRNNGRRDQKGSGRSSNRDTMEVRRSASYWTHDDRCDKEYDD